MRNTWLADTCLALLMMGVVIITVVCLGWGTAYRKLDRQIADRNARMAADEAIMRRIVELNPDARLSDFGFGLLSRIRLVAAENGLQPDLLMAVIEQESQWNPRAVGHVGEIGLMQVTPATGQAVAAAMEMTFRPPRERYGWRRSKGPRYEDLGTLGDPALNVAIGARHLAEMVSRYGQANGLRAYNRGESRVSERWPADRYAERASMVALHYRLPAESH